MGTMSLLVLVAIAIAVVLWGVGIYNGLITARNAYKNAFAQIDVQLQRRFDLIPNLVETAKGYMSHERETLEAVIAARSGAAQSGLAAAKAAPGDPAAMAQLARSRGHAEGALGRLLAHVEAYPDLKANQNMMQLSEELTSAPRTRSRSRARPTTTASWPTTTSARCSRPAWSPATSASSRRRCWRSAEEREAPCARCRRSSS
jgi:hypothetical protein